MNLFFRPLYSWLTCGVCAALISCAGPMSDPLGKHVYQEWVAEARNPGLPSQGTPGGGVIATDAFVFRMKGVKDYEYGNYVTNFHVMYITPSRISAVSSSGALLFSHISRLD